MLQIIEDLEPVRRGVYCGAVGWIDTERDAGDLAVAIRTFTVARRAHRRSASAAASSPTPIPAAEWEETELKAARLLAVAGGTATPSARRSRWAPDERGPVDAVVWLNGALVAPTRRASPPFDHGLLVGDGVFETLRVYDGVPFAWTAPPRAARARRPAGSGSPRPTAEPLRQAADAVLAANDAPRGPAAHHRDRGAVTAGLRARRRRRRP